MIDSQQFDTLFNKLWAAFATSKSDKIKEAWHEEFEDCDYFTFCKALKILRYGERFPTWGMIWDTYRPILPDHLKEQENPGCENCERGKAFYIDYILARKEDPNSAVMAYSIVGNCAACSENKMPSVGNVYRKDMHMGDYGEYFTEKALINLPTELEKVEKDIRKRREKWTPDKINRRWSGIEEQ